MTLGVAFDSHIKKCTTNFIKQYTNSWMNGNDGWYYYITDKSSDKITALKSNGSKIVDLVILTVEEASSFEKIEEGNFKTELDAVLCKAYLTGVYVKKKIVTGFYKFKVVEINIMEKT